MSDIKIEVWDATGNKRQLVEAPAESEVNRLIAVLIDRMNLPRHSPDGQMMSYKFHHKSSGRQLLDTETLASANVKDGDVLRLQPEITAGAASAWQGLGGLPTWPCFREFHMPTRTRACHAPNGKHGHVGGPPWPWRPAGSETTRGGGRA
jgi:hypothetical protein